jgi:hypothetical protein
LFAALDFVRGFVCLNPNFWRIRGPQQYDFFHGNTRVYAISVNNVFELYVTILQGWLLLLEHASQAP